MPENPPLVSVIVAVKNETSLLRRCLLDLLQQTYPAVEIIVVDDGSDQDTKSVLREFQQDKIKHISVAVSKGQSYCRNLGIDQARGEYIAIADADDGYSKTRIAAQVAYFEKTPDVSVLGTHFSVAKGHHAWDIYKTHDEIVNQMLLNNPMVHSTVMFRAALKNSGYEYISEFDTAEDYEVFARNSGVWKFANLQSSQVEYHIAAKSETSAQKQRDLARIIRKNILLQYLPEADPERVELHHFFSELGAGQSTEILWQHILFLAKNVRSQNPKILSKILYTHLWVYCQKYHLKLPLSRRLRVLWNMNAGVGKSIRILFK